MPDVLSECPEPEIGSLGSMKGSENGVKDCDIGTPPVARVENCQSILVAFSHRHAQLLSFSQLLKLQSLPVKPHWPARTVKYRTALTGPANCS